MEVSCRAGQEDGLFRRNEPFPGPKNFLEGRGMFAYRPLRVNTEVAERHVLRNADTPEKRLCRRLAALAAGLFLHAPDKDKKPLPPVGTRRYLPFQQILLAPEGLTPVDHDLRLGGEGEKEDA